MKGGYDAYKKSRRIRRKQRGRGIRSITMKRSRSVRRHRY